MRGQDSTRVTLVCAHCGRAFSLPGHVARKRLRVGQGRFCSRVCSNAGVLATDTEYDVATLAYAAGVLDGEGTILITYQRDYRRHRLMIFITNTDTALLAWFKQTFGGRVAAHHRRGGARPCYRWLLGDRGAGDLLTMLLPYLRVKHEQARLATEFRRATSVSGADPATFALREEYKRRISQLNY